MQLPVEARFPSDLLHCRFHLTFLRKQGCWPWNQHGACMPSPPFEKKSGGARLKLANAKIKLTHVKKPHTAATVFQQQLLVLLMHPPPSPANLPSHNLWSICPLCGNLFFQARRTTGTEFGSVMLNACCMMARCSGANMLRITRPKFARVHAGCHGMGSHQTFCFDAVLCLWVCHASTANICSKIPGGEPCVRKRFMMCLFVSSAASLSLASWHMLFRCATSQFFVLGAWAENWLKGTATLLECGMTRTLQVFAHSTIRNCKNCSSWDSLELKSTTCSQITL